MNIITYPFRVAGYYMSAMMYQAKSKQPREDVFLEALRRNGISMVEINLALDEIEPRIPRRVRLPKALYGRDHLIDRINSKMYEFLRDPENQELPREKRAEKLASYISLDLHSELAFDKEVFHAVMGAQVR